MKRTTWRKHHKWVGICLSFFLLMFCLSGIVLNHRAWLSGVDVSRGRLPAAYRFRNWNKGLLRGTLRWTEAKPSARQTMATGDSSVHVLVYGAGGIWLTDPSGRAFADFNRGLPTGADRRSVRAMVRTAGGEVFAITPFGLFRLDRGQGQETPSTSLLNPESHGIPVNPQVPDPAAQGLPASPQASDSIPHTSSPAPLANLKAARWISVPVPTLPGERLTDLAARGDSIVAMGRSRLYVACAPYDRFRTVELLKPADHDGRVTLFRLFWLLHSGELFGLPGQLVVDALALVLIVLIVTGWMYWLLPHRIHLLRRRGRDVRAAGRLMKRSLQWHNSLGRWTIVLTLLLCFTGWCLRPPLLIPLALTSVPPPPGTTLHSANPWRDKLRMLAYDESAGDWLLSTSAGFYALRTWDDVPQTVTAGAPSVSVMGLNVLRMDPQGRWLCGSFSGLYVWDRQAGQSWAYGAEPVEQSSSASSDPTIAPSNPSHGASPSSGQQSTAGYSSDFLVGPVVVDYSSGTDLITQPQRLSTLPISLWNLALEVHTGRIYLGSLATLFFVFIAGAAALWCLWSGWKLRRRKSKPPVRPGAKT